MSNFLDTNNEEGRQRGEEIIAVDKTLLNWINKNKFSNKVKKTLLENKVELQVLSSCTNEDLRLMCKEWKFSTYETVSFISKCKLLQKKNDSNNIKDFDFEESKQEQLPLPPQITKIKLNAKKHNEISIFINNNVNKFNKCFLYKIEYKIKNDKYNKWNKINRKINNYNEYEKLECIVSNLKYNKEYIVRICCKNKVGFSNYSTKYYVKTTHYLNNVKPDIKLYLDNNNHKSYIKLDNYQTYKKYIKEIVIFYKESNNKWNNESININKIDNNSIELKWLEFCYNKIFDIKVIYKIGYNKSLYSDIIKHKTYYINLPKPDITLIRNSYYNNRSYIKLNNYKNNSSNMKEIIIYYKKSNNNYSSNNWKTYILDCKSLHKNINEINLSVLNLEYETNYHFKILYKLYNIESYSDIITHKIISKCNNCNGSGYTKEWVKPKIKCKNCDGTTKELSDKYYYHCSTCDKWSDQENIDYYSYPFKKAWNTGDWLCPNCKYETSFNGYVTRVERDDACIGRKRKPIGNCYKCDKGFITGSKSVQKQINCKTCNGSGKLKFLGFFLKF